MEPPPFTPVLGDIPPKLGALFRQAFERGSEAGTRPSATDWISAINDLEQNFVTCTIDDGHNYWKGTTSCVWCRLASNGGPEYYYGVSADAGTFEVDDRRLQEIVRRLQQVERADFEYDRRKFAPNVAIVPRAMSPLTEVDTREHSIFSILLIVVATICAAFSLLIFLIPLLGVLGLIGAAASATAFFFHYRNSPKYREYLERKSLFQKASRLVQQVESEVESAILNYRQIKSSHVRAAYDSIRSCESLPSTFQQEIQALSANAELVARQRHLRLHSISDASISNIGYGRKQVLAAHQIYTAAEIDEVRIRSISGFGETLTANLVAWKNEVLRSFRFDPIAAVSPAARRVVIGKYRNQQNQLLVTAAQRVQQIEVVYNQVRQHLEKEAPRLRQVIENCERAKADLAIVK
jgi:DNA-binding helix-hairpin-helix protein with protein kinase domain